MAIDLTAWQGVIGALGGVAITGTIGLVTAKLTHGWQREEEQAVRRETRIDIRGERRRQVYADVITSSSKIVDAVFIGKAQLADQLEGRTPEAKEALALLVANSSIQVACAENDASVAKARLLASHEVDEALTKHRDWLAQQVNAYLIGDEQALADHEQSVFRLLTVIRREAQGMFDEGEPS